MGKRGKQRNKRARSPFAQSDQGDVSESPGGTRCRYAPTLEPDCQYHTAASIGLGRDVLDKDFREPEGYTLGHPYNRVVYTEFK